MTLFEKMIEEDVRHKVGIQVIVSVKNQFVGQIREQVMVRVRDQVRSQVMTQVWKHLNDTF